MRPMGPEKLVKPLHEVLELHLNSVINNSEVV